MRSVCVCERRRGEGRELCTQIVAILDQKFIAEEERRLRFFSKLRANANVAAGASAAVVLLKTAHINTLLRQTQINRRKGSIKMWRIWGFFGFQ